MIRLQCSHSSCQLGQSPQEETPEALDGPLRKWLEARFGQSFAGVRIHTGPLAAALADALGARAFIIGEDIYFAWGEYAPETTLGRHLLAHELTHVLQQRGGGPTRAGGLLSIGQADDPLEAEAERVANQVLGGGPLPPIHADRSAAIRRAVVVDPATASLTVNPSVQKAKPKVDIINVGTRKIAFNHLTAGINLANAAAGGTPIDDSVIKMVGKLDVSLDTGDSLKDFKFGFIQIGQVLVLEDTYVGKTLNEGHAILHHGMKVSPRVLLDSAPGFEPLSSHDPDFDAKVQGNKQIFQQTCILGIVPPDKAKRGDSPMGSSGAVLINRKTQAENLLFETRTDVGFTTVLVAIDPQKKVQPLLHVNWHLIWHFQFKWTGLQNPVPTAIPINSRADFGQVTKGGPTDATIAALVASPTGVLFNQTCENAKRQTFLAGDPFREDNFSRPSNIPADFFT